jgi:hypothetical protein
LYPVFLGHFYPQINGFWYADLFVREHGIFSKHTIYKSKPSIPSKQVLLLIMLFNSSIFVKWLGQGIFSDCRMKV